MNLKQFKNWYLITSFLIYINIFFGPLVRATDSGLACPDWPLCHGKWIPEYTFQIAMEVGHRYYSAGIGLFIVIGFLLSFLSKELKNFRIYTTLSLLFLITQVLLGALTVTKLLDPTTVNLHLLNASLLLLTTITIYLKANSILSNPSFFNKENLKKSTFSLLLDKKFFLIFIVFFLVLFQIFMGGRVSSHYSGLACPDFPTCYGEWFPELIGTIRYQMEHRWVGYFLVLSILFLTTIAIIQKWNPTIQKFLIVSTGIVVLQIGIGACNVWFRLPKALTALHTLVGVSLLVVIYLTLYYQGKEIINKNNLKD